MIWAIGDIQGCYDSFSKLLKKIDFNPKKDQLWLAGDLVNRGHKSREVLEYLYSIRKSIKVVLGNHDIALLAVAWGIKKSNPTLDPILKDPKSDKWIDWLRRQPFIQLDTNLGYVMAHAGLPPEFGLETSLHYNRILMRRLQSKGAKDWLKKMMEKSEDHFDPLGGDLTQERYMLSGFTRMRFCYSDGRLDFDQKGSPSKRCKAKGLMPWFEVPIRKAIKQKVIFGHWSTLGYFENDEVCCLDSGCLWQGKLTAKRLDSKEGEIVQVACLNGIKP